MKLYHADVLDGLQAIEPESVDLVFADPPFNVGVKYGGQSARADRQDDYYAWCAKWLEGCFRLLKPTGSIYLMTLSRHIWAMENILRQCGGIFINQIIWKHATEANDRKSFWNGYQPLLFFGKSDEHKFNHHAQRRKLSTLNIRWGEYTTGPQGSMMDIWEDITPVYTGSISHPEAILRPNSNFKQHPAQMPLALPTRAILFSTDEQDVVLDPFNGSGTTGEACINTRRQYLGIEREEEYVALSQKRWQARINANGFFDQSESIEVVMYA